MAMPGTVLMAQMAAAPSSTQARAICAGSCAGSCAAGVSLAMTGSSVARAAARVACAAASTLWPMSSTLSTFGQLMFSSRAATPGTPSRAAASSPNSAAVSPATFTITGVSHSAHTGAISATMRSTPGFCRPMELSIPAGVSTVRGWGLPSRGRSVTAFVTNAPSRFTSC